MKRLDKIKEIKILHNWHRRGEHKSIESYYNTRKDYYELAIEKNQFDRADEYKKISEYIERNFPECVI